MLCSVNVNIRTKILVITSVTLVVVKFTEKCLGELVLHCFVKFIVMSTENKFLILIIIRALPANRLTII